MIVAIEGIDGCGKTSVVAAVVRVLARRQKERLVRSLAFPDRSTVTGQVINEHLKATPGGVGWLDPYTHQALQVVNRLERLPELKDDMFINVCSRYTPSAFVYGRLDGCAPEWLSRVTGGLPPADLNVLLAVDPETAWQRMHERGVTSDAYERRGVDWFRRAAEEYEALWTRAQRSGSGWLRLDARSGTPEELAEAIVDVMEVTNG